MRCCLWKRDVVRGAKPPADGTEVFVLARPGMYEAKGEFQLNVVRMLPTAAIGQAQRELERVKVLLQKDGLFDLARKRPLPAYVATWRWSPARPARQSGTSSPSPAGAGPVCACW